MTDLEKELANVPNGCRYIEAPNFQEIWRLLKKGTPYIRNGRVVEEL